MLYESMLLFGVLFIAGYFFDTLTQSRHALYLREARQWWFFAVLGLYFVWFWRHGGQTLAMKTWHIRLVKENGERVGLTQALLRYVLFLIKTGNFLKTVWQKPCWFQPNQENEVSKK
jgi:uncharacterized RDD family membrane protein YckC